jgi:hypothetical protein
VVSVSNGVLSLMLCGLAVAVDARADGIPAYLDDTGWHLMPEDTQYAVVGLRDGKETLLLQVKAGNSDAFNDEVRRQIVGEEEREPSLAASPRTHQIERLAWVVPIPAPAQDVKASILDGFADFFGVRPRAKLASDVRDALGWMASTQIYPAVFVAVRLLRDSAEGSGLEVLQSLRREGVELELISAASTADLSAHLQTLGVAYPADALRPLDSYTGARGTFVVYRIIDFAAYVRAVVKTFRATGVLAIGIRVVFPADKGFFPLAASSGLPGHEMNIVVTTVGFHEAVAPLPFGMETTHYVGGVEGSAEAMAALGVHEQQEEQRYTRFVIHAEPNQLGSDLRFSPGAPIYDRIATHLLNSARFRRLGLVLAFGIFVGLSMLAAVAARRTWPEQSRLTRRDAARLGLANLLTLIGLVVVAILAARRRGLRWYLGFRFALATSEIFCGLLIALAVLTLAIE